MTTALVTFPGQSAPVPGETLTMPQGGPGRVLLRLPHARGTRSVVVVASARPPCPSCGVGRMTWAGAWRCERCGQVADDDAIPADGEPPQRVYLGQRDGDARLVARPDGSPLELAPSLAIRGHSPDGFEWGDHGSGPAQLALALLLDHTGDADLALRLYQRFKAEVVSTWRGAWALDPVELAEWLRTAATAAPA